MVYVGVGIIVWDLRVGIGGFCEVWVGKGFGKVFLYKG